MKWIQRVLFKVCTVCRPNQSRTIRLAFPLTFVAAAFLAAQVVTSQGSSIIVVPSTNSLREGEPFSIHVYVDAKVEINAVNLELGYPEDQMKVTGIDTGESVITLWTVEPYAEAGTVHLRGGTFRRGFKGQHLIATVKAKALDTGIAEVGINESLLLAGDGSGTKVKVTGSEDSTKVYIANADGTFAGVVSGSEEEGFEFNASVEIRIHTDIDGDGDVSLADLSRFMSAWFSRTVIYDFDGDGRMTFRDFAIILSDSFFR